MKELEYPFDSEMLLKKKKNLRKQLLEMPGKSFLKKKIAILGGFTTNNIKQMLELFLLNYGIQAEFYESEYNRYYEDGMFPNGKLEAFAPDLIYICTCNRNIYDYPALSDSYDMVRQKENALFDKFKGLWEHIRETYHCPVIQNNFELPFFRLMGNKDASDYHGRVNFVTLLNCRFYEYAQMHDDFYICDINYLSASYGLDRWSDLFYWHMYKCAVAVPAVPCLSFNVANIIKSLYGKNKKAFNLDLDNTLWGGTIGEDGADSIEIGQETPMAQAYSEFQEYLKLHQQSGILLTINSKNDEANALEGLNRPDSILAPKDFVNIKANWKTKDVNLMKTAQEMALLPEAYVFVDDNPAERAIIEGQFKGVAVPPVDGVEQYIKIIDKSGYFEATNLSQDDFKRTERYLENEERNQAKASFENYEDYLESLEMEGEIQHFIPAYMSRIAQLTNKSNQFNLTTKRYSKSDIELIEQNPEYVTLYGKLRDKFGDNGVVSVLIGKLGGVHKDELHMELWLMSCRVLKRDLEYAMMDELMKKAKAMGIRKIVGYYYPTAKNAMVQDFYDLQGFAKVAEDAEGNTVWEYETERYEPRNKHIFVNGG